MPSLLVLEHPLLSLLGLCIDGWRWSRFWRDVRAASRARSRSIAWCVLRLVLGMSDRPHKRFGSTSHLVRLCGPDGLSVKGGLLTQRITLRHADGSVVASRIFRDVVAAAALIDVTESSVVGVAPIHSETSGLSAAIVTASAVLLSLIRTSTAIFERIVCLEA